MSARRAAARNGACAALLLGVAAALTGCSEETARRGAPTAPRAILTLEPPSFGIGQVATLEVAVVTPPDHTPRPFAPPQDVPGLWVLGTESEPVRKEAARWIHRTLVRVRARTTGDLLWPAGRVEIEGPDGSLQDLPLDALPIAVTSVRPDYPDRTTPFGVRSPPPPRTSGLLLPAAGGALLALAGVALARLAGRRWSQRPAADAAAAPAPEPPWTRARAELEAARALAAADPFAAAHATHTALRRYMTGRFGAAAASCTTEEIAAAKPPFAATSRWRPFVEMLRSLDEFRFLPESDPVARRALTERLGGVIDAGESFVTDSTPPEPLR